MRAVEGAKPQLMEPVVIVVIVAGKPFRATFVLPDPFAEPVVELLMLFARRDGLHLIDDPRIVGAYYSFGSDLKSWRFTRFCSRPAKPLAGTR